MVVEEVGEQYSICGKTRGGGQQCIFDVVLTKPVGSRKT